MIHLLGTVELSAGGRPLPISSRKTRTLLACLALDLERPQSVTSIAERLWDGDPPPSAVSTLHGYLSRLRTALRRANELGDATDGAPIEIVSRSGTYTLHAEADQVDWQLYYDLARQARRLAEDGDDRRALAVLRRADSTWQGEPLAGLPGLWAQQVRSQLLDRRFAASLTRFEVELRLGHFADLVPDLTELAEQSPWNERVAAHLMTALYGCGRIDEALTVYRRIRRRMYDDLATNPGEALDRLHEGILRRARISDLIDRPAASPVAAAPPPEPERRPSTLLPAPEISGRESELDLLTAAARGEWPTRAPGRAAALPVIALSGQPGCGKSALALAAAHRLRPDFPDGAFMLRLAAHSPIRSDPSPETAATDLLRQFGVPAPEIPLDSDELLARCRELLSQRRALVLFDNAAGPDQIGPLLPAEPTCFILITSRHRMAELPAVSTVPLDVLTPAASAAMFTRLVGPDRADDQDRLADVTRRCAHLPLALHLIAGRFRSRSSWDLAHLADRLSRSNRLGELRHGPDSLHRALAMSYHGLSADHQVAFRRLSLHPGNDFGLLTAAVLIDCPVDRAERLIEDLLADSLLAEHAVERFSFHELVREYAAAQELREESAQERSATIRRCVNFLTVMADRSDVECFPTRYRMSLGALSEVGGEGFPHLPPEILRTVPAPGWLAVETASLIELEKGLRADGDRKSAAVLVHVINGRLDAECLWREAIDAHRSAADHWRDEGAAEPEMHAQLALSHYALRVARYPDVDRSAHRALALAQAAHDLRGTAEALGCLAQLRWRQGELRGALALQHESLATLRGLGTAPAATAAALANLGMLQNQLGEPEQALDNLTEALPVLQSCDDLAAAVRVAMNIAGLQFGRGDVSAARESLDYVSTHGEGIVPEIDLEISRANLAELFSLAGDFDRAIHLLDGALRSFHRLDSPQHKAEGMIAKARILVLAGNPESAGEAYAGALAIARSIHAPREEAAALRGLSELAERWGRAGRSQVTPSLAAGAADGPQPPEEPGARPVRTG
ncbi:AfsR/SARP family transcriptional regulator [Kitasatospora fiedleri]|uniref:AfsR/SARP family transcriptional regulator n=1 Tax=Kitasatospora fiedleri TaxID=2991545 RepID=UPI00249C29C2|nr:BTAD domain-containing putative transcriptional regulator [Kitasatospora fiedleri]